jgi:alpha-galactosidase
MLPLGRLRIRGFEDQARMTRLTHDEQRTLMTLWLIFRAPLMIGADLPSLDSFTLSLFDNPEVLAVDQRSSGNHQLFARGEEIAWTADIPGSSGKYLALFNLDDSHPAQVRARWSELGLHGKCAVRDLWQRKDVGSYTQEFSAEIPSHGAGLYRIARGE